MPDPTVKFTLDVTAQCDTQLESYCVRFLTERGFNVTAPHSKWETLTAFCKRVGINKSTLTRRLRPWEGRPNVALQTGKMGVKKPRTLAILSNPDFDAYCVANKSCS